MSKHRPFRFSLQSFNTDSPANWRKLIAKTEDLGYSTFFLADHFLSDGPALEHTYHPPQMLAAVPAIAMALEQTSTLRVGCRVFCNDYRNPVILAKEAATMDYLSGGRLEFGIGAGWIRSEYEAVNLAFDEFPERFTRFAETVHAYKAFMAGEALDIQGESVRWSGFAGTPAPAQSPHPPLMIGGGSKKILEFAGREADIVSLNFNNRSGMIGPDGVQASSEEETQKKIGWVREGAGDRFDDLTIEIGAYFTFVMDDPGPVLGNFAQMFGFSEDEMRAHPHALFGSVDTICEELERRRALHGISYVTVGEDAMEPFAAVVARLNGK